MVFTIDEAPKGTKVKTDREVSSSSSSGSKKRSSGGSSSRRSSGGDGGGGSSSNSYTTGGGGGGDGSSSSSTTTTFSNVSMQGLPFWGNWDEPYYDKNMLMPFAWGLSGVGSR